VKVIAELKSKSASGITGILNSFKKLLRHPLARAIARLMEGCWQWKYHSKVFKTACTVVLCKPGKPSYQHLKA
jgi:hypothetical protein